MLDPIVDARAPFLGRLRKRVALATGFLLGVSSVAAVLVLRPPVAPPPAPPPAPPAAPPPAITLTAPPPLVVTIEQIAPMPPAAPPPPADELGCPVIDAADVAIGKPVIVDAALAARDPAVSVVAAAGHLAVLNGHDVWISNDDGATFGRAFVDASVDQIALADDGTLYARVGGELAVRETTNRTAWHRGGGVECDGDCTSDQLGVLGTEVVWIHEAAVSVSRDRGVTWTKIKDPASAWNLDRGEFFRWRGALFETQHYSDMCGVDDTVIVRIDAKNDVSGDIFHNYHVPDEPILVAGNDVDPTWTWSERCPRSDDNEQLGRCTKRDAARSVLLQAATLHPAEGGRALALWEHSVVELCDKGVRQVYRSFPFSRIDAVDAAGRAIVVAGNELLRWSPAHGWRKLFSAPEPSRPPVPEVNAE